MKRKTKGITVCLEEEMYAKIKYIAAFEYRTISRQVRQLIRRYIERFETEHGEIPGDEHL